jgi:hydrolase family protein
METQLTPPASPPPVAFTGCCPPFDPTPWIDARVVWRDKPFVKAHVHCLFHIPLDMGSKMKRADQQIQAAQAAPPRRLMLSDETSPWGSELFIEVTRAVPEATMTTLSGTFLTKVYEGPYRDTGKWADDMRRTVSGQRLELDKLYFGYTTCPRCARAYGKNYVIVFARLKGPLPTASGLA